MGQSTTEGRTVSHGTKQSTSHEEIACLRVEMEDLCSVVLRQASEVMRLDADEIWS